MEKTVDAAAAVLLECEQFDADVLASNLKELRRERGIIEGRVISGAEVSRGCGMSEAAYRGYEYAQNGGSPSYENAWAMADYYGVSLDELGGRVWPPGTGE